jgi:predicted RNA-binding Zn ribbon-like protein
VSSTRERVPRRKAHRSGRAGAHGVRQAEVGGLHGRATAGTTTHRPPALFIADSVGLDFLNSIATPVDAAVEWIGCGADLAAWLAQAQLVPDDVLATLRASALPGELDAVAAQARALREWFRGFVLERKGRPLRSSALTQLEPLNAVLARDEQFARIVTRSRSHANEAGSALEWRAQRRWRSPESLLLPIARALADLVCDDFIRVKGCEGPDCVLLFMDRTNSGTRRWCNMAICGNRAKQSALRARLRRGRKRRS